MKQICETANPPVTGTTISVVVPSYKRPSDLRRCLSALKVQKRAADEILVILRAEDRETLDVVAEFSEGLGALRGALVKEPGLVAAINRGLDCATGDFIVLTDDDAEAFPEWLENIEITFLRDPAIGAAGGRDWIQGTVLSDPPTVDRVGCLTWWGRQYGNHHCRLRGHTKKVDFLKGVNFGIRRSALQSYRIDTSLRGSGAQACTEIDLCMHMKKKGFDIVFDDRILVKHYATARDNSGSERRLDTATLSESRFNNHYMIAKHFGLAVSLMHLCNGLLLGSRYNPGLLACVKWSLKGERNLWRHLCYQSAHVWAGFQAGRRAGAAERRLNKGPA